MIHVAICDDDILFLHLLENRLSSYKCKVYKFNSFQSLLNAHQFFDIAFIDIELNDNKCGFDLISHIRNQNPRCVISIITSHSKYAIEGYDYHIFNYILKSEPEAFILKRINAVFNEHKRLSVCITGTYKDIKFSVSPSDIYYIETYNHVLTLHSNSGDFNLYKPIGEIESFLKDFNFFRCHRSYIVNMAYIKLLKRNNTFVLNTSPPLDVPIGIRYKESAKTAYLNYSKKGLIV